MLGVQLLHHQYCLSSRKVIDVNDRIPIHIHDDDHDDDTMQLLAAAAAATDAGPNQQ